MLDGDIEPDICGAKSIGGKSLLVYAGKIRYSLPDDYKNKPDFEAKNLSGAIALLEIHINGISFHF